MILVYSKTASYSGVRCCRRKAVVQSLTENDKVSRSDLQVAASGSTAEPPVPELHLFSLAKGGAFTPFPASQAVKLSRRARTLDPRFSTSRCRPIARLTLSPELRRCHNGPTDLFGEQPENYSTPVKHTRGPMLYNGNELVPV